MRKNQKEKILDIFNALNDIHYDIQRMINENEYENAINTLEQCQNAVMEIGNNVIDSEGENAAVISYLVDYCRIAYELSVKLSDRKSLDDCILDLCSVLITAEEIFNETIESKLEIVFMPYKASMWDSLESVWKAADEDPECDAYVVPIPYYDRNPDHSFGELHYEGNDFPEYVPITHYRDYDERVRKPDVIFIHNPYDDCNYVTSVAPRFYSFELKKYTDKLVYIPYFVIDEMDDTANGYKILVENLEHFALSSAVINSDLIIVQSEKVRKIYIDILTDNTNICEREYWENKIYGLGSPKVEKILNVNKKILNIPDDWKRYVLKNDNTYKRIIFYNTGISGLLSFEEDWINKINYVFQRCNEVKEDVVLIWRPHPLIETTLKSMKPELLERYTELKKYYISQKIGIYDDTADATTSIIISDIYYGDASSLTYMFKCIGKPYVVQDAEVYVNEQYNTIAATQNIVSSEHYFWYISFLGNALYRINRSTYEKEFVTYIGKKINVGLYSDSLILDNKIYFSPLNAKDILIYDIDNETVKKISIKGIDNKTNVGRYFSCCLSYGDYIYMIPEKYHSILVINKELDEIVDYIKIKEKIDENAISVGNSCVCDDKIFLSYESESLIIEFDCKTNATVYHNINSLCFRSVFTHKDLLYLVSKDTADSSIFVWDYKNKCVKYTIKMDYQHTDNLIGNYMFSEGIIYDNKLFIIPDKSDRRIMVLDLIDNTINYLYIPVKESKYDCIDPFSKSVLSAMFVDEKSIILVSGTSSEWFEYNGVEFLPCKRKIQNIKSKKRLYVLNSDVYSENNTEYSGDVDKIESIIYNDIINCQYSLCHEYNIYDFIKQKI